MRPPTKRVIAWTALVALAAAAAFALLPLDGLRGRWTELALLAALALAAGSRPVRIPGLKVRATASDLFVFVALFALPGIAAPLVALAGTLGAVLGSDRGRPLVQTVFNLASVTLAAACASFAFGAVGSVGCPRPALVCGFAAAATYHLLNVVLVSSAIRLDGGRGFWVTLMSIGGWSGLACAASLVAGAGISVCLDQLGLLGLVPGLTVTSPMTAFFERVARIG